MASRDNQTMQIFVIVLALVSLCLSVALFMVNNSRKDSSRSGAETANNERNESNRVKNELQQEANNYKTWIGFSEADTYQVLKRAGPRGRARRCLCRRHETLGRHVRRVEPHVSGISWKTSSTKITSSPKASRTRKPSSRKSSNSCSPPKLKPTTRSRSLKSSTRRRSRTKRVAEQRLRQMPAS